MTPDTLPHAYLCIFLKPGKSGAIDRLTPYAFAFDGTAQANQHDCRHWHPVRPDESRTYQPDEIPELIATLVCHLPSEVKRCSLMVELFLPDSLFFSDIDRRTSIGKPGFGVPIGVKHLFHIRLLERAPTGQSSRYDDALIELEKHWRKWKQRPQLDRGNCYWFDPKRDTKPFEFFRRLVSGQSVCVIGLAQPNNPTDVAAVIREAGIPIVLWQRAGTSQPDSVRQDFADLLQEGASLPLAVQAYRHLALGAEEPDQHPGSAITLLWDNPNRPPPALEFEPLL